jgi:bacterioferritin
MLTYKLSLEECGEDLEAKLFDYYNNDNESVDVVNDLKAGLKDLQGVSYENPYEAYLITQLKMVETLPPVIEEHIRMLNVGDDIDLVLESFELEVYHIKKDIYSNMMEWEALLDHITDGRITEITCNPKGYGDLILKELIWIRKFEEKLIQ